MPQVFFAQLAQNLGAAGGHVAEGLQAGFARKGGDDLGGESLGIGGKGVGLDNAGDFPMAGGGVLAGGALPHPPEIRRRSLNRSDAGNRGDVPQPQPLQSGQGQPAAALGHMAQRIGIGIAVTVGIGQSADPDAIESDQNHPAYFRKIH